LHFRRRSSTGFGDSLDAVLQNVAHRSAGTGGVDMLQSASQRQQLIAFLVSIDARHNDRAGSARHFEQRCGSQFSGSTVAPESL